MDIKEFYIDGEWVSPDGTDVIDLINPANEEITGSIISASKKDVDDAVKSAKKSFEIASALTLEQKKKVLQEIIDGMDIKDLMRIVYDNLESNLEQYSVDELIEEVEEYYPHLLEESNTN